MKGCIKTSFNGKLYKLEGSIFNVNESANSCSMRMANGETYHDLPYDKVEITSKINEGLWDRVKKSARSLKKAIEGTFERVGSYLIAMFNGKPAPAVSPINAAIAYDNGDLPSSIVVFPSEQVRDIAADAGLNIVGGDIDDVQENEDALANDVESINNFWAEVMARQEDKNIDEEVSESYKFVLDSRKKQVYESKLGIAKKMGAAKYYQMFEAYSLEANENTNMPNVDYDQLKDLLEDSYMERIDEGNRAKVRPIMIWGAPGIGKTTIVKDLIREMNESMGFNGTMIEIDATSINPDDFSLPMIDKDEYVARDVPKTWFPAYRYVDGMSEDEIAKLDNIANGGSDSVEGTGGIIFIDEFSRIRKATMQVLMKLVDQRSINDLRLGSKWLIVCAGNREEDMGGDSINWQMAWGSRYLNVNYVPDFEHWVEWAENAGVEKDIIRFLKLNQGLWYDKSLNDEQTNFANPRTWDSFSNAIKARRKKNQRKGYANPEPSDADKVTLAKAAVGNKAGLAFQGYLNLHKKFDPAMAAEVWEKGDKVDITFRLDPANIEGAFETILDQSPKEINEKQVANVYSFMNKVLVEAGSNAILHRLIDIVTNHLFSVHTEVNANTMEEWIKKATKKISARLKEEGMKARTSKL